MANFIAYRDPSSSGLDYNQLMMMLAYKRLAEQQSQNQRSPSTGLSLDKLFPSSAAGYGGGSISNSVFADPKSIVDTAAPDYLSGYDISAATPEASALAAYAPPAAAIAGTILGGRAGLKMLNGDMKAWGKSSLADKAGRVTLGIATGGLSEVGNKLFHHKTTKSRQNDKWNSLYNSGKVPDWFIQQGVTQDQGIDDKKLANGSLGAKDVWASSAFFNKFSKPGQTWDRTGTEAQREQIAKEILDNKLLDTRKGLTRFTNENAVQDIYDRVLGNKVSNPALSNPNTQWQKLPAMIKGAAPLPAMPSIQGVVPLVQRSQTLSPGIDKNGRRISYGR